jgi:hypothetical protein
VRARGPELALAAGALVVAVLAVVLAVDVRSVALDEMLHKQQAVRYLDGLPGSFVSDPYARATARLYPLVLTPVFAVLEGDGAVRTARALGALLFVSAALPAYLLARELRVPRAHAAAAGVLAVALPWAMLATVLYTEVLAYPLFVWVAWAVARALRAPSPGRDVVVLALLAAATLARAQLACLAVAWLGLVAARVLADRARARRFPATAAAVALGLLGALAVAVARGPGGLLDATLGTYRGIVERGAPTEVSVALLAEAGAFVLGLGVVPAIVGAAWWARAAGRRADERWWPAVAGVALVAVTWATTLAAQGGFLGPSTEERYFVYAAPLLWVGALAALAEGTVSRRTLAGGLAVAACVLGLLPLVVGLNPETGFLAPVLATAGHAGARLAGPLPGGPHDVLVALALAAGAVALAVWRRPARRWAGLLVLPVLIQLALTGYVAAAARGALDGVPPRTEGSFAALAWVDRVVGREQVSYLRAGTTPDRDLLLPFWNSAVRHVVEPPGSLAAPPYPTVLLPTARARVGGDGAVAVDDLRARVVQDPAAVFLQLAGRRLAGGEGGTLELVARGPRPRARWATAGLEPDGQLVRPVALLAAPGRAGAPLEIALTVQGPPGAATALALRIGPSARRVELPAAPAPPETTVRLRACGPARGVLEPRVTVPLPDGRPAAARVLRATVRSLPGACPGPPTRLPGR